jgi:hypothetical protein
MFPLKLVRVRGPVDSDGEFDNYIMIIYLTSN